MHYKIVFLDVAVTELTEAYWWYTNSQAGLGEQFLEKIDGLVSAIAKNPKAFQKTYKSFRQAPLDKFPFVIIYKEYSEQIVIHAVFHTKQNPYKKYKK